MPKAGVENTSEGGGLYAGQFEITAAQFNSKSNFGGQLNTRICTLEVTMNILKDGEVAEHTEYLSVNAYGKNTWSASEDGEEPSKEGNFLYSADDGAKIQTGTPAGRFLKSCVDVGIEFPNGYDAEVLVGVKGKLGREAAPVKENENRTLAYIVELLDEFPSDDEGSKPKTGKSPKPKFEKNGTLPKGAVGKGKAKDDDDDDEDGDDDGDDDGDEDGDDADADGDSYSKEDLAAVTKAVLAANKGKALKLKMLGQAVYAVVPKQFKQFAKDRKALADAVKDFITSGGAKKIAVYDEDEETITAKK